MAATRKQKNAINVEDKLNEKQKEFCRQYIYDWNATNAYISVYKGVKSKKVAQVSASNLLLKPIIQAYIKELQSDVAKYCGISREMVVNELKNMAFSSIASLHNTWIEKKDFELLTKEQKKCIQEINTKVIKRNIGTKDEPDMVDVEYVSIKLYDKNKSIETLNKMVGWNEPDKLNISGGMTIEWKEEKSYVNPEKG